MHQGHETATVVNNTGELGGSEDIGTAIELLLSMIGACQRPHSLLMCRNVLRELDFQNKIHYSDS